MPVTRRDFLGTSAAVSLATLLPAMHVASAAEKDTGKVRLAVMGLNGRGKDLLKGFLKIPNVEVLYLCDPDAETLPAAAKIVDENRTTPARLIPDFRTALDDQNVDALVCAAPDHWHALATVLGCQAGKDVYVEKPACHNPVEGRRMVAAARHYKRIVQVGTQRRSGPDMREAVDVVKSGELGDVNFARCWITSQRPNIGRVEVSSPPAGLDFNLWCGPGQDNGYKSNLVHYHWHWRWEYGTGECGNNGIHALDVARWGLGVEYPDFVSSGGGKYFFDDDQETPDTQTAMFDFKDKSILWEHRTWSPHGVDGENFGVTFYGSKGTLQVKASGWTLSLLDGRKEKESRKREGADAVTPHLNNFIDCVASRETPSADIEIGHRSTLLCHLANIAWRTRSTLEFDSETESIKNNAAATALLGRSYRKGFELPTVG